MFRRPIALVLLGLFAATAAAQPAPKEAKGDRFRVALDSKLTMNGLGKEMKLESGTSFDYTWKRNDKTRTLILHWMTVKAVVDGQELMNATMSRAEIVSTAAGKKSNIKFEDAPEPQQKLLSELFDSPIYEIEVDAVGKEVKRKILASSGAVAVLGNAMIASCTMFHPWYSPDKNEWRADAEVSAGDIVVKGPLIYKKTTGGKAGQQLVKVSGTLTANGVKNRNGNAIKNGKYIITGQQTYDTTRKEWIAGQWAMDISFTLTNSDKEDGQVKGKMTVTFELLPEKK